ncbi:DUF5819 family protein [Jeotgalibacillus marinus]|uniref:DUF5819 family protein n=1 Tax=Jeotgalibacillus marinus TaxID=86667 RepID=A0ABV3Q5K1_9BACL
MWKKVVGGFLCLLFVIHFSVTAVHNTHANPLQVKYNKQLSFYIDPLFTQNWRLFAPTPMTSNNYFYVKAKLDNGNESRTTDWIDLVQYMYEKNNDNRFTPYNKLIRIPRGAYALIGEKDETVRKILNKVNEGELDEEEYEHLIENERDKLTEEKAIDLLNKFAEAHLISFFPENEIVEFKVLLVESEPVPFSKNGTENFENAEKYREFDWTKPQGIIPLF